jgi:hypothetical protein
MKNLRAGLLVVILLVSCNKQSNNVSSQSNLNGNWRGILEIHKATDVGYFPPSSGEPPVTFVDTMSFENEEIQTSVEFRADSVHEIFMQLSRTQDKGWEKVDIRTDTIRFFDNTYSIDFYNDGYGILPLTDPKTDRVFITRLDRDTMVFYSKDTFRSIQTPLQERWTIFVKE